MTYGSVCHLIAFQMDSYVNVDSATICGILALGLLFITHVIRRLRSGRRKERVRYSQTLDHRFNRCDVSRLFYSDIALYNYGLWGINFD
jgi:hypothetical protein